MAQNFVYEGLEGAGKTLHTILLTETLRETTDFPVMAVNEPGGTDVGAMIRFMVLESEKAVGMHPTTRMLLYSADRNELIENRIKPFNLAHPDGITVGDRTWPSTLALQIADGAGHRDTEVVQELFIPKYPSKIFLLDIREEESAVRLHASKKLGREINWRDKMTVETYAQHRKNYLELVKKYPDKFVLIDGFKKPWEIIYETRNYVLKEMSLQPGLFERSINALNNFYGEKFKPIEEKIRERVNTGYFGQEGALDAIETSRKELGAQSAEELRAKMHEDWRSLGLENATSGLERGK